jgi:hypothetical protein
MKFQKRARTHSKMVKNGGVSDKASAAGAGGLRRMLKSNVREPKVAIRRLIKQKSGGRYDISSQANALVNREGLALQISRIRLH